jgi:hypothetical protein
MTFDLLFDSGRRILLIRFGRSLTEAGLAEMQAAAQRFVEREGGCDGIIDFSAVEDVDLPSDFLVGLARRRAVLTGHRRVIVASQQVTFGLSRMFGSHQDVATGEAPIIVHALKEAYDILGASEPDFQPVEQN